MYLSPPRIIEKWDWIMPQRWVWIVYWSKNYMLQYQLSVRVEEAYMAFWRLLSGFGTSNEEYVFEMGASQNCHW